MMMMEAEFTHLSSSYDAYDPHESNMYENLNCFTTFGSNLGSHSDEESPNGYDHYQNTDGSIIPYVEQAFMTCAETDKIVEQLSKDSIQDVLNIIDNTDPPQYEVQSHYNLSYGNQNDANHNFLQYPEYSVGQYQQQYYTERHVQSSIPDFSLINNSSKTGPYSEVNGEDSEAEEERELQKKRGAKNILLWKFLLEQLQSQQRSIRWISMEDGTFRFIDTTEISKLWGEKKRKSDMNFEKLSRGIRHYYRQGMMTREEGTRLVYRFHWQKIPKKFRRKFVQL